MLFVVYNRIVLSSEGIWLEDAAKIQEEFLRNFQAIFSPPDRREWQNLGFVLQGLPIPMLTFEQKQFLGHLQKGKLLRH